MVKAILFDLGNTLISYYTRPEFPKILKASIEKCINYIVSNKGGVSEKVWDRVQEQNHGSPGNKVFPMEDRLSKIFSIDDEATLNTLCDLFMEPIFETSRLHDDVVPVLKELKRRGFTLGIISNTPWGCPSRLWRKELERYRLLQYLDVCIFCVDVGWRKPDERVFNFALERLGVEADECLFVGDDPIWDVVGPEALGMETILIDRTGRDINAIHGLDEIFDELDEPTYS